MHMFSAQKEYAWSRIRLRGIRFMYVPDMSSVTVKERVQDQLDSLQKLTVYFVRFLQQLLFFLVDNRKIPETKVGEWSPSSWS